MRRTVAVVSIVLMSALGACGGSDDAAPSGGSGPGSSSSDDDASDTEATPLDACKAVSADEVGKIIGATVTSESAPFDSCEYDQEDPRATSVAIGSQSLAEMGGGFEAYKSGTSSALKNAETVDVPGVGDSAFITTGTFGDGTNIQLQGAASVKGLVVTVNLTQASDITADVLVAQAKELLTLAASKA